MKVRNIVIIVIVVIAALWLINELREPSARNVGSEVGGAIDDAADGVGDAVNDAADGVGDAVDDAADAVDRQL